MRRILQPGTMKSARGLAHSKTLSRVNEHRNIRQVLGCGGPPPLFREEREPKLQLNTRG